MTACPSADQTVRLLAVEDDPFEAQHRVLGGHRPAGLVFQSTRVRRWTGCRR
jgi:hypothetical protein